MNRCDTCPGTFRFIPGDGPEDADVMCVGEAPGQEEDRSGIPFIGKSGREFNENYLNLAGLHRRDVYVTNAVKCRPDQNKTPSEKEALTCAEYHLADELDRIQPTYLILMGATACKLLPDPLDLEIQHGIPIPSSVFEWQGWVIPMYHPAAGLHSTAMMQPMLEDWANLKRWLETGNWQWAMDQHEDHDYRLCRTSNHVDEYFFEYPNKSIMGGDTELHGIRDWSLQVSTEPGTAIMVLEEDTDVIRRLGDHLFRATKLQGCEISLHQGKADLPQFQRVIEHEFAYRDTMQEAYHLGNLPQGLKALAYRTLGVRMTSWKDTVEGASREALCSWIVEAMGEAESLRIVEKRFHKTTGKPIMDKVTISLEEKKLTHFLTYSLKNVDYEIWKRIKEYREAWNLLFSKEIGAMPVLGIGNMILDKARDYGCLDADVELRVALALKALRAYTEQEEWRVAEDDIDPIYTPEVA